MGAMVAGRTYQPVAEPIDRAASSSGSCTDQSPGLATRSRRLDDAGPREATVWARGSRWHPPLVCTCCPGVQPKWSCAVSVRRTNVSRQSSASVITATEVPDAGQANEKQL